MCMYIQIYVHINIYKCILYIYIYISSSFAESYNMYMHRIVKCVQCVQCGRCVQCAQNRFLFRNVCDVYTGYCYMVGMFGSASSSSGSTLPVTRRVNATQLKNKANGTDGKAITGKDTTTANMLRFFMPRSSGSAGKWIGIVLTPAAVILVFQPVVAHGDGRGQGGVIYICILYIYIYNYI